VRINWIEWEKSGRWVVNQSKLQIFSTSITKSNLDIFWWLLKHWIQLIQNYNDVFQSMKSSQSACVFVRRNIQRSSCVKISSNFYIMSFSSMIECEVKNFKMWVQVLWWLLELSSLFRFLSREDNLFHFIFLNFYVSLELMKVCCNYENSQCAWIDSNEKRWWQMRAYDELITSCNRYLQPQLLSQTSIFFHYFWRFELIWFRARIMSFKVCEIVNAHRLIRARKDDGMREIDQSTQLIFSISITRSNLNIFPLFLKIWTHLIQS